MSSEPALRVADVGKAYPIFERPWHRLAQLLLPGAGGVEQREFWALQNVSFEVQRGETVGIVGRNGSGKSTLLQLICGTLNATTGQIEARGRIAALLELGAGFNPEFTGRENVFLYGTVLGLTRTQIEERFDAIAAFADIGEFVERPIKHYSSGMYVRLAFAVAISVEPEILVIDEALSVGDEAFQRKCLSRIEQLKRGGTTTLFVSHSAGAIVQLCDRAILLEGGRRLLSGSPKQVVTQYQKLIYAAAEQRPGILAAIARLDSGLPTESEASDADVGSVSTLAAPAEQATDDRYDAALTSPARDEFASRGARIKNVRIEALDGRRVNVLDPRCSYRYCYEAEFDEDAYHVHFGMLIKTMTGVELFGSGSHPLGEAIAHVAAGARYLVRFSFQPRMLPGTYFMNAGIMASLDGVETFVHRVVDVLAFRIEPDASRRRAVGFVDLAGDVAAFASEAAGGH